ncbi:MAG: SpaA isopeptide-forming pilin-related protein, partial [Oscillospiraceae bacterium]
YDVFVDGKDGKVYIDVLGSNGKMQENIEYTTIEITNDFTALDGEFKLIKQSQYDKENPVPLKDVTFTLNGTKEVGGAYDASAPTDKDGVISFSKIPAGKYTLTETVPADHTAKQTEYEVIVNGETGNVTIDGKVYTIAKPITIINSKIAKKGNFQFTKLQNIYNEKLKPLIGVVATFTLTNDDTTQPLINVDVDQTTGEVIFTDIPAGTYTLTETFVDSRYEKSPNSVKVTVNGKTGEVTFEKGTSIEGLETLFQNKYTNAKSKFSFVKNGTFSGRDDYPIAGAKFELKNADTNEAVTVTSGKDGIIEFSNIAAGKYILKEVNAPNGYKMSGGEMTVYADKYTGTVTFTDEKLTQADAELTEFFKNEKERKVQDFSFTKYKKTGETGANEKYEGVVFRLTDATGNFIDSDASGANGIISFKNLADGEYILTELLSPDPLFIISNAKVKVVVDSFNNKITYFDVTNGKAPTEIDIVKMETLFVNFFKDLRIGFSFDKKGSVDGGKTSYPLAGAEFTLNNNTFSDTVIADENGKVSFTDIPNGLYTLAETKAPKGYELSQKTVLVEVNGNTGIVKFSYDNAEIDPSNVAEKLSQVFLNNIEKRNGDFSFIKYGIDQAKPTVGKYPLTGTAIFNLHGISGDATGFNDKKESATHTGLVAFSGLQNGSYILSELDSLDDYIESKQLIWVEINTNVKPDQSVVSFFEATKTGETYAKGNA